jgi:hypothetical protein
MSVIKPLQNSLNDVIGVWSESREAVSCPVCLELPRLTSTRLMSGGVNINGFDGRCTSSEALRGDWTLCVLVLCYCHVRGSRGLPTTDPTLVVRA